MLRLGTRGSKLALAQAEWVRRQIAASAQTDVELVRIKTSGDRFLDQSLAAIGGKGLFVKEIEEALLAGDIDLAVHSMKDLPNELAPGLTIAAIPPREDPGDVLVSPGGGSLADLPPGARLGTSSLRRAALAKAWRPDLVIEPLRGNVDTRLTKLARGDVDAIVLAAAGLKRLGLEPEGALPIDPERFPPAVGQGALAIETRSEGEAEEAAACLDHRATRVAVEAERSFLRGVGGSCHTPIAAYARLEADTLDLVGLIADPEGGAVVRGRQRGPAVQGVALGAALARDVLARGGAGILANLAPSDG